MDEKSISYCDALLLQFKNPIVYDLTIPDSENIYSLVKLATRVLSGEKIDVSRVNCISCRHGRNEILTSNLQAVLNDKSLAIKLNDILVSYEDSNSVLEYYLNRRHIFRKEFIQGNGTLYAYRTNEIANAVERVNIELSPETVDEIYKIAQAFQPFIGLTDSPCKQG